MCVLRIVLSYVKLRMQLQMVLDAGTFTLSNLGMFGVDRFDAILPPGQVYEVSIIASSRSEILQANLLI